MNLKRYVKKHELSSAVKRLNYYLFKIDKKDRLYF